MIENKEKVFAKQGYGVKQYCEECGADDDILLSVHSRKKRDGDYFWVCATCFIELEGVGFEDYRIQKDV